MSFGFAELIGTIESEIETIYMPGAIKWCDEQYSGAWSNALDRFDKALQLAIERKDFTWAKSEGEFYKLTILKLLRKYKEHKCLDNTQTFLNSLNTTKGELHG
jgi:hypothetical protein